MCNRVAKSYGREFRARLRSTAMKEIVVGMFSMILSLASAVNAEDLGVLKINPSETKKFTYKSKVAQVLAIKVQQGPTLPQGQRGFVFGWDKQSLFCEGKHCADAGGYLLFCPNAGVITAEFKNLTQSHFEVAMQRVECDGKDAGTMRCPSQAIVKSMCR
jgi:hypothetical protein